MTATEVSTPATRVEAVPAWNGRLTIQVKVAGSGPPLVYLHPAAGPGPALDPFVLRLAERYTVYAPEFPGTSAGDPYAIHAVHTLPDVVLIYEEVLRKLGVTRTVLVGQSFGGMLAAELASVFPDLASKVVLLDPIGLWREDLPIANWMATPPDQLPALLFHDPSNPGAQVMLAMPEDLDQAAAAVAGMVWAMGATGKFTWPIPDRGLRDRLHRLSAPVLLVWGREDRLIPVGYVEEWQKELANCQAVIFDDCGHIPQVEAHEETFAAVEQFLLND